MLTRSSENIYNKMCYTGKKYNRMQKKVKTYIFSIKFRSSICVLTVEINEKHTLIDEQLFLEILRFIKISEIHPMSILNRHIGNNCVMNNFGSFQVVHE